MNAYTQTAWRTLQHITLSPSQIDDIARADLILNGMEVITVEITSVISAPSNTAFSYAALL